MGKTCVKHRWMTQHIVRWNIPAHLAHCLQTVSCSTSTTCSRLDTFVVSSTMIVKNAPSTTLLATFRSIPSAIIWTISFWVGGEIYLSDFFSIHARIVGSAWPCSFSSCRTLEQNYVFCKYKVWIIRMYVCVRVFVRACLSV